MNYISTGIYIIQLVLYYLISDGHAQGNVKNIIAKVLGTNCTVNGGNICRNKYLQICFSSTKMQRCGRTMPSDCLFPIGSFDTSSTELTAVVGSNSSYDSLTPITTFTYIVVGITPTTSTERNPLATSCEESRKTTKNGFRVKTRSTDGYQFEILIENICRNPTFCGLLCDTCVPTTTVSSKMVTTSDIRSAINTSTTTFTAPRLRSTVLSNGTTTGHKTVQASSSVTESSSPIVTSEDTSTVVNNGTNNSTSNPYKSENSSNQSRLLTIIIALVSCIVVILIVIITMYKCYRKHNRMSRTTPAEDDKNCLVKNDHTTGGDAYSSTGHSNSLQNHNENLQRENASNEGMPHTTTDTINETLNNAGSDGNGSMSANQNETTDTTSVSQEQEDNKSSSITATSEDIEHENTGSETVMHDQQSKKKKKKKKEKNINKERSIAHVPTPTILTCEGVRNVPADEQRVNANGQNNDHVPDDEISDALPSNASVEVSGIDVPTSVTDNGGVSHPEQMTDDFQNQANSNGDVSHQVRSNGGVPCQAQSNCDVPHQAQSNGDNVEISREDTERNATAKIETFLHGKISEFRRDITEETNNSLNQVKEEFTEKMLQQREELKELISKKYNEDLANSIEKREIEMKKLEDYVKECTSRLETFQREFDDRIKASGDKHDDARPEMKEHIKEMQKLRDELDIMKKDLKEMKSYHKGASSATDNPPLTETSQINESLHHASTETHLPHPNSDSRYASESLPSESLVPPVKKHPASAKKRQKETNNSRRVRVKSNGVIQLKDKDNHIISCGNMGSVEILNLEQGAGFIAGDLEIVCRL